MQDIVRQLVASEGGDDDHDTPRRVRRKRQELVGATA
jgi:hypothetical protein